MKIIIDHQKVTRRARLANVASLGGMLTLLGSAVLPLFRPELGAVSTVMMFAGLLVAMVGIYFANRWVKKPRPEDRLDAALKSLSDGYRLYHYPPLPCDHVLLAPTGVVILETVNLDGQFSVKDSRWKQRMTLGRALRWVVEEHLGNPARSALSGEAYIQGRLAETIPAGVDIPVKSVVVFTHPGARLEVEGEQTVPVCKVDRLKKIAAEKGKKLPSEVYEQVCAVLENREQRLENRE